MTTRSQRAVGPGGQPPAALARPGATGDDLLAARRRLSITLFCGVASGTTGFLAAVTGSPLAAERIGGATGWAGLPTAAGILGTALGAWIQGRMVASRGRRRTLLAGYGLGAVGALGAAFSVWLDALPLLVVSMMVVGLGNSSNQLARYAHAEIQPPARRAFAISVVVWAGTIGAVVGPSLIAPASRIAAGWSLPELSGPYVVSAFFLLASCVLYALLLRPDPSTIAEATGGAEDARGAELDGPSGTASIAATARLALTAMLTAQIVMVLIMTATPVHLGHLGAGLGVVGLVMSSHTFGMFALAPLFGRLADLWGRLRTITLGLSLLAFAALLALFLPVLAPEAPPPVLAAPLFLLGLGWSCAFVAGSSLLAVGLPHAVRARLQGRIDGAVLGSGAVASALSGVVLGAAGYPVLAASGLALVGVAAALVHRRRRDAIAG